MKKDEGGGLAPAHYKVVGNPTTGDEAVSLPVFLGNGARRSFTSYDFIVCPTLIEPVVVRRVNTSYGVVSSETEKDYRQDNGSESYGEFIK